MLLNTSLTLCMEIVFPGGGGSGRSPFESAAPGEGLRGVWVCRDVEKRARIVVDGVVKDVDTGGGWGNRPVIFSSLEGLFPCIFGSPGVVGVAGRDGARGRSGGRVSAPARVRARKNAGIWALPCAGTRRHVRIRTRWVSGSSCTGAWPAWWRRPGHLETSTGRLLGRPLQGEVHAARATAGRPRSPFCARSCAGIGKNVRIRACAVNRKCRDLGIPVRGDTE